MSGDPLEMTMLFDFYGGLLTEKQREYFDLYHNEDLSLAEIAANVGITRQGVHDIIRRATGTLEGVERKTGLIQRFGALRESVAGAEALTERLLQAARDGESRALAEQLADILRDLKGRQYGV
ncbi:MAG: YlxM family DNA-binding protein [Oscillospiraceae bacterium]|jgi:predicted DNA-binding protein YlxM (UPF0122 family)|nr:YlxM family DNA-binding protein [Oscillospiraceae bacterium]